MMDGDPPYLRFRETAETKSFDGVVQPTGEVERQCWVEEDLGDGFMVAYRLVPKDGRAVIAEARIYPGLAGQSPHPGECMGQPEEVPDQGLRAGTLRKLHPDTTMRSFGDIVGNMRRNMGEEAVLGRSGTSVLRRHGFSKPAAASGVGRPQEHDDLFFAELARDYVRLVLAGSSKPIIELAQARLVATSTIESWVRTARDRGLLTNTHPGRAGGELTAAAQALLDAHDVE
jgi:hypothetical protein